MYAIKFSEKEAMVLKESKGGWGRVWKEARERKKFVNILKSPNLMKIKKVHYILMKITIHHKYVTIINLYVPNIGVHHWIKQTLKDNKYYIYPNTITVGNFFFFLNFKQNFDYNRIIV